MREALQWIRAHDGYATKQDENGRNRESGADRLGGDVVGWLKTEIESLHGGMESLHGEIASLRAGVGQHDEQATSGALEALRVELTALRVRLPEVVSGAMESRPVATAGVAEVVHVEGSPGAPSVLEDIRKAVVAERQAVESLPDVVDSAVTRAVADHHVQTVTTVANDILAQIQRRLESIDHQIDALAARID